MTRDLQELFPCPEKKCQRKPNGMAENGNLSDTFRDTPYTDRSGGKKCHVAWAQTVFLAILICYEDLAGNDAYSFVGDVMPLEASSRALPDDNVRGAVVATCYLPGMCQGGAVQNPGGQDGYRRLAGFKIQRFREHN